jgi:hypothetical protein
MPWMWSLATVLGYEPTREAAMQAARELAQE